MAAKWDIEFSEKQNDVIANHPNLMDGVRKDYKGMLVIKVFQVYVEVGVDKPPPKTEYLVKAAKDAAEGLEEIALSEVHAMAKAVADLQKEEQLGNKKAAETAKKLVEKVEKSLKNLADEFGMSIRKAVQKALLGANKQKCSSTSRTVFRGVELDEGAFEEDIADEIPAFFNDIVKQLVTAGTEISKLSSEEADNRLGLVQTIKGQMEAISKSIDESVKKGGKGKFDMPIYVRENPKEPIKLEQAKDKYTQFLKSFEDKIDEALKSLDKLEKLSDKEDGLKDNKAVGKEYADFRSAATIIRKTFEGKHKAADLCDDLYKSDWKNGAGFMAAQRTLEKQPSTLKSGKNVLDAARELEKLGKG